MKLRWALAIAIIALCMTIPIPGFAGVDGAATFNPQNGELIGNAWFNGVLRQFTATPVPAQGSTIQFQINDFRDLPNDAFRGGVGFFDESTSLLNLPYLLLNGFFYWVLFSLTSDEQLVLLNGALTYYLGDSVWEMYYDPGCTGFTNIPFQTSFSSDGQFGIGFLNGNWFNQNNYFFASFQSITPLAWIEGGVGPDGLSGELIQQQSVGSGTNNLGCVGGMPKDTDLLLTDDRFRVQVKWRDTNSIPFTLARGLEQTDDSGLFYFFNSENTEMLVRVLDACQHYNRFWVFAGATTNVEYELTVTDTQTDQQMIYTNPLNNIAQPITDTSAFATCP